jgi:hypothetical protein
MMFGLTNVQLILIGALIVVIIVIITMMNKKKEKLTMADVVGPTVDYDIKPADVRTSSVYDATFTPKVKYPFGWACPDMTYDYDDGRCLTSQYGPMIFKNNVWKCPAGTVPNDSDDWNMKCVSGFSKKKMINGRMKCYDTEIDVDVGLTDNEFQKGQQCAIGNQTVFTTREYSNGKWACPTGTFDTGMTYNDGANGGRQCQILPF